MKGMSNVMKTQNYFLSHTLHLICVNLILTPHFPSALFPCYILTLLSFQTLPLPPGSNPCVPAISHNLTSPTHLHNCSHFPISLAVYIPAHSHSFSAMSLNVLSLSVPAFISASLILALLACLVLAFACFGPQVKQNFYFTWLFSESFIWVQIW